MLFFAVLTALSSLVGVGLSASLPASRSLPKRIEARQATPTASGAPAHPTICGDIIDEVNDGFILFFASDAYACLTSVPFNPAVATRFVKYWNETIQFHSSLAYLKNPPPGYQQPAFDVIAALNVIQKHIDEGYYANQYDFEAEFQLLTYSMHDAHVALSAGILSAFSFASPYSLVTASVDGKEVPKVYIWEDIIERPTSWQPSAIKTINGVDAVEFLTRYAALNSIGGLEPHTDWNSLMRNPVLDVQGLYTVWDGAGTFYPGENLTFTFENGTKPIETVWIAIYNAPANVTGPLTTGGDFYNYYVLGLVPASFVPVNATNDDGTPEDAPVAPTTSWVNTSYGAFPDPDVFQADLGEGGIVSGYFLEEASTGVLSIPSFAVVTDEIDDFSATVDYFIHNATKLGLSKIVIDLQRNDGGAVLLAFDTFKQFFPDLDPYAGSRRRIFPMGNIIGNATSSFYSSLSDNVEEERVFKEEIAANEWVIVDRLNAATGKNFSSWQEYQDGPTYGGDKFSLTERYDLANPVFDAAAFDNWVPTAFFKDAVPSPRPWAPDQIAILTDGICSSTCSLFVEMMTRAGVRTVVVGGRPSTGPMQHAAGNRGALAYSASEIDDDINFAGAVDDRANASLPQVRNSGIYTNFVGLNLRDQVRDGDTVPLQFKYEAADCRIYYTLANIYNMTKLWLDASNAVFKDQSLCVQGSTGFSATNNTKPKDPPKLNAEVPILSQPLLQQVRFEDDPTGGLKDGIAKSQRSNDIVLCASGDTCTDGISDCKNVTIQCTTGQIKTVKACLPPCNNRDATESCPSASQCRQLKLQFSKKQTAKNIPSVGGPELKVGTCFPTVGTQKLGCPANPKVPRPK